jgi:hypothetical protein
MMGEWTSHVGKDSSMMNGLMATHPSPGAVMARQVALGIIVGCAITSVPWLVSKLNYEGLWPFNFLWFPGLFAAVALSGNVHAYSLIMALAVNVTFYASLTYLLVRIHRLMMSFLYHRQAND